MFGPFSAQTIANYFILFNEKHPDKLTNLTERKLQLLLYFAQLLAVGKYLEPIFEDAVKVEPKLGPYIPSVSIRVTSPFKEETNKNGKLEYRHAYKLTGNTFQETKTMGLLNAVVDIYGKLTEEQLTELATQKGSAFTRALNDVRFYIDIRDYVKDYSSQERKLKWSKSKNPIVKAIKNLKVMIFR
ncbi:hypothetical protein CKF54_00395 [Psittacicella hinzii]|uniref:Uncharacterized protein n=1 Tax=Psittacicella hinzii TaxID=2028575 RepID=A0A3A1YB76_9GAMM|nr:type II toxin-antitoxin system antitoxin SocA domain-containing protein [Psittacicella hinzii]RIY34489.1 hypothetical protein CKF54_00395 [Psittacicella hinzii]